MIDYYRLPLKLWYWYRETLLGIKLPEPVKEGIPYAVRITSDRACMGTDGTENAFIKVEIIDQEGNPIANSMEVELEVVSGGAVFPTGKRFVFSPENKNFYEGLGAIELRSYYAGENRITAKAKGLVTGELIINATGGEYWENQKPMELLPPPSVMEFPKSDKSFNIGVSRPVFSSSEEPDYAARNVTDPNSTKSWRAGEKKPGEWIMVDLEGSKPVNRGELFFEEVNSKPYEISISGNGVDFEVITVSKDRAVNSFLDISLGGKSFRYFRVLFPEEAAAVFRIKLFN